MAKIPLTRDKFALVDDDDFDHLNQWKWYFGRNYAQREESLGGGSRENRYRQTIFMHKQIIGNSSEYDHINRNKLDNRKSNLRPCTHQENTWNAAVRSDSRSGYRGVSWYERYKKWAVNITKDGIAYFLGYFNDKEKAAKRYNAEAIRLFGEFAFINRT